MTEEEIGQIEWFKSLREILERGDIETAKKSVDGAIKVLERQEEHQAVREI